MIKTKILILISVILNFLPFGEGRWGCLFSQPVQQEWLRIWDDSSHLNDHTSGIALDNAGNIYVAGDSYSGAFFTTIKYSPSGVQQWVASYPGNPGFECRGIVVDASGNSYVTALSGNIFTQIFNFVLIKYNTMGQLQWARSFGDYSHSYDANDCIIDRQGNIYVVGETNAYGGYKVMIVKYNPSGDTLWSRFYSYLDNTINLACSIAIDSLNNVVIGGSWYSTNNSDTALIIKYSSAGNLIWSTVFNGWSRFMKVGADLNNNIYATGNGFYPSGSSYEPQYLTIKYNSSGVQQWFRVYRSARTNSGNFSRSLAIDNQGNCIVTGQTEQQNGSLVDSYGTIKYNPSGDSLWTRINGSYGKNYDAYDITLDKDGNCYIYGESDSLAGAYMMTTVKYDINGLQKWIMYSPGGPKATTKTIAIDQFYNVYTVGDTNQNGNGFDYVTVKYSQLIGIKPISKTIPDNFKLYQNYPNPFNPSTNIKFEIATSLYPPEGGTKGVKLVIYDILGKEVSTILNEKLKPGTYEVNFNGSNYPSGVYFYQLIADGKIIDTKKMIVLK